MSIYVYKITNIITSEFYYGYRYKNQKLAVTPKNDLWIIYFTSSTRIKKEIQQYGKESFRAEIIYKNIDSVKCWQEEQIIIKQNWGNPLLLNGKYHDPNSNVEIFRRVNFLTEETRYKMSMAGKGKSKSEEHKKKIATANTGNIGSAQKKAKLSAYRKGKPTNKGMSPPKFSCQHCGSIVSNGNLKRWHDDKCKLIDPKGHTSRTAQVASINKK